jgi:uncharacterized protein
MRRLLVLLCLLAGFLGAQVPPAPTRWVTDGPGLLSPAVRDRLDSRLEAYQRGTGHQVLVWIGDTTGGSPLEDWTVKAFAAWKVGRKGLDDGVVLFILAGDHKVRMEVGYGLEGQVPDVVAFRIIQEDIIPGLKAGTPDGAVTAGVERLLKVVGGDAAAARPHRNAGGSFDFSSLGLGTKILIGLVALALLILVATHPGMAIWFLLDILSSGGGGGGGGGGSGGGGFSGGGGSSGGGGASGSW